MQEECLIEKGKSEKRDTKIRQLDFLDILSEHPDGIVSTFVRDSQTEVYGQSRNINKGKNVLVCFVKKDNIRQYLDCSATIYYTGKRFPSTIDLEKLCYFVPYLSGHGIRDLYRIKGYVLEQGKKGKKETVRTITGWYLILNTLSHCFLTINILCLKYGILTQIQH